MARRRYFRYYPRTVKSKKKWASNIRQGTLTNSAPSFDLVGNSSQSSSPTPVIVKTGNFRIQGDISIEASPTAPANAGVFLFLVFVPEGNTVNNNLINNHPEWVMAWSAIDFPYTASGTAAPHSGNKFSLTSRLKRNLNSGDKVVLYVQTASTQIVPQATFTAQFFTCAN